MSKKIGIIDAAIAGSAPGESAEDQRDDAGECVRYAAEQYAATTALLYEGGLDGTCIVYYPPGHPAQDE
jgi:hypothetical protein